MPSARAEPGQATAAPLKVGGLTPFTTLDYPGRLSAVVFVQGCPWRCAYCHNPHLQPRGGAAEASLHDWPGVRAWLRTRRGLVDAVVFSGGEPTIDPGLAEAMRDVRRLGFAVGLHTAGIYPRRLREVLPLVDWVGLDVKAPLASRDLQDAVVGVGGTSRAVASSLALALAAGVDLECRTTAHPAFLADADLLRLGRELSARGVRRYALQAARPVGVRGVPGLAPRGYPAVETVEALRGMFESFVLRDD